MVFYATHTLDKLVQKTPEGTLDKTASWGNRQSTTNSVFGTNCDNEEASDDKAGWVIDKAADKGVHVVVSTMAGVYYRKS